MNQLQELMLKEIFIQTGGRPENPKIAEICAELADKFYTTVVDELKIEEPVLVGHLNKFFGYNRTLSAEAGTPVYEFQGRYQFDTRSTDDKLPVVTQKFDKETLAPCINFISHDNQ